MTSSAEVGSGCPGVAGSPSPVLSGLQGFREKLEICQERANLNLSVGLLIITSGLHRLSPLVISTLITVISSCDILMYFSFKMMIVISLEI